MWCQTSTGPRSSLVSKCAISCDNGRRSRSGLRITRLDPGPGRNRNRRNRNRLKGVLAIELAPALSGLRPGQPRANRAEAGCEESVYEGNRVPEGAPWLCGRSHHPARLRGRGPALEHAAADDRCGEGEGSGGAGGVSLNPAYRGTLRSCGCSVICFGIVTIISGTPRNSSIFP